MTWNLIRDSFKNEWILISDRRGAFVTFYSKNHPVRLTYPIVTWCFHLHFCKTNIWISINRLLWIFLSKKNFFCSSRFCTISILIGDYGYKNNIIQNNGSSNSFSADSFLCSLLKRVTHLHPTYLFLLFVLDL